MNPRSSLPNKRAAPHAALISCAVYGAYLVHLLTSNSYDDASAMRSLCALLSAALIFISLRRCPPATESAPEGKIPNSRYASSIAVIATTSAAVAVSPLWWIVALPLASIGILPGRLTPIQRTMAVPLVGVLAVAFPFEVYAAPRIDLDLQYLTAVLAEPLLAVTGLQTTLGPPHTPSLLVEDLTLFVSALCAGTQSYCMLLTLGWVAAGLCLQSVPSQLLFVALTPIAGLIANVVRVVASGHAAYHWLDTPAKWELAHDAIGYGVFVVMYLTLWLVLRWIGKKSYQSSTDARPVG